MSAPYRVDPDITAAATLDASFYRDEAAWALARERVFARTWQWIGDLDDVTEPATLSPREMLPGLLDEPLLLARDADGTLRCLSNVCTHRGNMLVNAPCRAEQIRCGYHSRRFDLAGRMTFMPEFEQARHFPSPADDLPHVPFGRWARPGVRLGATGRPARCVPRRHAGRGWPGCRSIASGPIRRAAGTTMCRRTGRCTWRTTSRACTSRSCTRR